MPLYRDTGIVLRTYKFAEADRIVVFITADHGQVRAVAKGVRKTKSRFGGRLECPSHLQLQIHEGRGELQTVSQVETVDHFRAIRDDLDRLTKASALCEVVEQFSRGRDSSGEQRLYPMLLGALRVLADRDAALLVPAFHLKLLASEGLLADVSSCVSCSATTDLVAFDPTEGGVLCRDHRRGVPVSGEAVTLVQRILGGSLATALAEPVSTATHQVEALARAAVEHHLERRLKTASALEH